MTRRTFVSSIAVTSAAGKPTTKPFEFDRSYERSGVRFALHEGDKGIVILVHSEAKEAEFVLVKFFTQIESVPTIDTVSMGVGVLSDPVENLSLMYLVKIEITLMKTLQKTNFDRAS